MASSDNSTDNSDDGPSEERTFKDSSNAPATSVQAEMLLQALQNFIIPLVNTVTSIEQDSTRTKETPWAPEAGKLLSALQEFISCIIRSQTGNQNGIEVDLAEDDSEDKVTHESTTSDSVSQSANKFKEIELGIFSEEDSENVTAPLEPIQDSEPALLKKLLDAVRYRIFSKMPIRMLHIVPRGIKLQVRLIERGALYAHLASHIETDFSTPSFISRLRALRTYIGDHISHDPSVIEYFLKEECLSRYTSYAILSHTWLRAARGEVTYSDWRKGIFDSQHLGYGKLVNFCKTVWQNHGLTLCWMDTVCIDKESSSELDESIRSMYKWYKNSAICITYLAGTSQLSEMHQDPWFTRGWTLQELLAPLYIKFYDTHWKPLIPLQKIRKDDTVEADILTQIYQATTIQKEELWGDVQANMAISRKLQLAAKRQVMREEDIAYSLMGLCNVSFSIAYGEGEQRALRRLIAEILSSSSHPLDVFNCTQMWSQTPSIIPYSLHAYVERSTSVTGLDQLKPIEPLILTHLGLRIPLLLMPALRETDPDFKNDPIGDYYASLDLRSESWEPYTGPFQLLDKGVDVSPEQESEGLTLTLHSSSTVDMYDPDHSAERTTFGVLNFGGDKTTIEVPDTCLAVGFQAKWNSDWESISTSVYRYFASKPMVFKIRRKIPPVPVDDGETDISHHLIKRSELAIHGMKIVTMYL